MAKIVCYDYYGNTVSTLTQWDTNRIVIIKDWGYDSAPVVLISTISGESTYTVESVLSNGEVSFYIPNDLLEQEKKIIIHLCLNRTFYEEVLDSSSNDFGNYYIFDNSEYTKATGSYSSEQTYYVQKNEIETIYEIKLPIRKRTNPGGDE